MIFISIFIEIITQKNSSPEILCKATIIIRFWCLIWATAVARE